MYPKSHETRGGFPCTVYYRDNDNNSGYGDNAEISVWFGPHGDEPDIPDPKSWKPNSVLQIDEFDLACERRND